MFGIAFGAACWAGRAGFEAATFGLAVGGAVAGLSALRASHIRDRRLEQVARELAELTEAQRRTLADAAERRPQLAVLFLNGNAGVERARVVRKQPRPLDIEQTVAFERALALRTLPPAKAPLAGSLEVYRKPTEHDRETFRKTVEAYGESLQEALERYDAYLRERAGLVSGRFRLENRGRRSAHDVTVRVSFPGPFETAGPLLARPGLPQRPTFRSKRAALAALMGGDARRAAGSEVSITPMGGVEPRARGAVSRPSYRPGSALVEVDVDALQPSSSADMDEEAAWILRLPRPGEYVIEWEAMCEELVEPVRGELRLEVVDLFDGTPIRSIKELLDADGQAAGEVATFEPDLHTPVAVRPAPGDSRSVEDGA